MGKKKKYKYSTYQTFYTLLCDLIVSTNGKKKNEALCQKLSLGPVTGWTGRVRRDGLVLFFFQFLSNFCQTALQSAALHPRRHGNASVPVFTTRSQREAELSLDCARCSSGDVAQVCLFLSAASRRCFSVASLKRFLNMHSEAEAICLLFIVTCCWTRHRK